MKKTNKVIIIIIIIITAYKILCQKMWSKKKQKTKKPKSVE